MSWQTRLLANMDNKQTKNCDNHAIGQRIFLSAGTRHAIKGALQTQSETLGSLQTRPIQVANHKIVSRHHRV